MTDPELETLITGIVGGVREELARELQALERKLVTLSATLEARPPAPTLEELRPMIERETARELAATKARLETAPTLEELRGVIAAETVRELAARPAAKDGISLVNALLDRAGHLILTASDGRTLDVGAVVGAPGPTGASGAAGAPGRDAVLKGALVLKRRSVRAFEFCWADDGSPVRVEDGDGAALEGPIVFPVPIYKGVWNDPDRYEESDLVTHDGSVWMAKRATVNRPGRYSDDWQLVVKRGADGPRGKTGDPGPPGRDLTQMDPTGRKW